MVCNACAGCWTPTSWRQWALTSSWLTSTTPSLKISRQGLVWFWCLSVWQQRFFLQSSKLWIKWVYPLHFCVIQVLPSISYTPQGHEIYFFADFCWAESIALALVNQAPDLMLWILIRSDPELLVLGSGCGWYQIRATTLSGSGRYEFSSICF